MKEDRLEDLLRAMDHPEEYTEEALQQLLSDEENRECYELAVKAHAGFKLGHTHQIPAHKSVLWMKAAAVIAGVLILSGITLAAVYIGRRPLRQAEKQDPSVAVASSRPALDPLLSGIDSVRIFENAELEQILNEAASHYHVSVEYGHEQVRHIRLYTKWNRNASLDEFIDRLNGFEKVSIRLDGNLVTVE